MNSVNIIILILTILVIIYFICDLVKTKKIRNHNTKLSNKLSQAKQELFTLQKRNKELSDSYGILLTPKSNYYVPFTKETNVHTDPYLDGSLNLYEKKMVEKQVELDNLKSSYANQYCKNINQNIIDKEKNIYNIKEEPKLSEEEIQKIEERIFARNYDRIHHQMHHNKHIEHKHKGDNTTTNNTTPNNTITNNTTNNKSSNNNLSDIKANSEHTVSLDCELLDEYKTLLKEKDPSFNFIEKIDLTNNNNNNTNNTEHVVDLDCGLIDK